MLNIKLYSSRVVDEMDSMDPYEQQLLSVFNSYDISHRGSLDQEGLLQLCNSLQLEEQGVELIKCLLPDSKSFVTFSEFKEGLLALLGNVQSNRQKFDATSDSESESPDREVSPKFVYGSKKYGRRSRPESTEQIELFDPPDADLEDNAEVFLEKYENKSLKNLNKVQRSNSQSDVTHSRKRKTSGKLKRCTSFPGNHEMRTSFPSNHEMRCTSFPGNHEQYKTWNQQKTNDVKLTNAEYNHGILKSALEQLGIGSDGYLSHLEISRVCEFMGIHKLAKIVLQQLANRPEADSNKKVSIEDFLEVLQKDDCVYEESPTHTLLNNSCISEDSVLFPNKSLQYITMGPNGSGLISSQAVVELWENAGILSAAHLLQELGFKENTIGVVDLATILEDELRSINEARGDISFNNINPHIVLLQASIALYQSEVKYLKSVLEQLSAERDKLRTDIAEANQRASLLAQEVDDNHAKLEKSTRNQVRQLEQKHSDVIKELTSQYVGEKEQMTLLNTKLEQKILSLETEEAKLKSDQQAIQKYNNLLEKENNMLSKKLSELELVKSSLTEKVSILELECQKICEIERERDQLEPLLKKLSVLQLENAELRDKNDELSAEVENLNTQVARNKNSSTPTFNQIEDSVSGICEGVVGLGAIKRRVDSPSKDIKDNECSLESESPRLGKVRRCYHKNQPGEVLLEALGNQLQFSNESGFEAELDSLSFSGSEDEVSQLQTRIVFLEQLLLKNSIKFPASSKNVGGSVNDNKAQLVKRCKELESILEEVQQSMHQMISTKSNCKDKCDLLAPISQLSDKIKDIVLESSSDESLQSSATTVISVDMKLPKVDSSTETEECFSEMQKNIEEKIKENKELSERCEDLEQAIDLLRSEFDNCENYWANKLDEERQMFDQEQKQSSDKLTELLVKISEYEEQFTQQEDTMDGRLSPIEEKGLLEQQFTELEEEFDEFRSQMEATIELKDKEIASLQEQLNSSRVKTINEVQTQTDSIQSKIITTESKTSNLSNVVESTNIFSSETLPHVWNYPSNSQTNDSIDTSMINIPERDYINPTFIWQTEERESSTSPSNENNSLPSIKIESSTSPSNGNNSLPSIKIESSTSPSNGNNSLPSIKIENHCSSLPPNISWQVPAGASSPQPHSMNYIPDGAQSSCRPKRTRKHDRSIFTAQLRPPKKEQECQRQLECDGLASRAPRWNGGMGEQTCVVPLNSIHHLHGRLRELDQHCRHLQFILKQQQRHSESVMHHCWQQHRDEINEIHMQMKSLQEKLARSDMLVKDLYVENTYLMANNQRLEYRCNMLVQCSSESTSV